MATDRTVALSALQDVDQLLDQVGRCITDMETRGANAMRHGANLVTAVESFFNAENSHNEHKFRESLKASVKEYRMAEAGQFLT